MYHLLNKIQGYTQNGPMGNDLQAQDNTVTDVGVAAGGLGTAIASAIVQFNKGNVMGPLITMVAAPSGTSTVRFPVYTKHTPSDSDHGVKEMASGAEETIANLTNIETTASDLTKIDESNFASLQNDIYEHFQDRIGMFNEGIIRIRENALKKAGRKTVTPEEMRRAGFTKGQRYTDAKGDSRRALQFKNFQKKTLANASAGAGGVGKLLMMEGG